MAPTLKYVEHGLLYCAGVAGHLKEDHMPTITRRPLIYPLQSAESLYLYLSAPSAADKVLLYLPPNAAR